MKLFFQCKNPGLNSKILEPEIMEIKGKPSTVSDLIKLTVEKIVEGYNEKSKLSIDDPDINVKAFEEAEILKLASTGKIAFGLIFNDRVIDSKSAVDTALKGYKDGLFKIFKNNVLLEDLDSEVEFNEGDLLSVVRLTFLSGRII